MTSLNRLTDSVRESLEVLAEGWHDLWNKARHAITRFTPAHEEDAIGSNRWGLLSAELHEAADTITVNVEAPGLTKDDFEIFVVNQTLVVRGTKSSSKEHTEGRYLITERAYGKFERVLSLPAEVNEDKTTAGYRNGVLTIQLPKSSAASPKVISIS